MSGKEWAARQMFTGPRAGSKRSAGSRSMAAVEWLAALRVGEVQRFDGLQLAPILAGPGAASLGLMLAHEAVGRGLLEVTEVGEGVVQSLRARNCADRGVLVLEGETLIGCKQNRVVARTVLIAAGAQVVLPVGCIERRRWSQSAGRFDSGSMRIEVSLRRRRHAESAASRSAGEGARINQGALWADIASRLSGLSVSSPTDDYSGILDQQGKKARRELGSLPPLPGQVGVVAAAGGHLLGLELTGSPDLWSGIAPRTLGGYALSAPVIEGQKGVAPQSAESWLDRVRRVPLRAHRAVGEGIDYDFEDAGLVGAGLWHAGRFVHLAAFEAA